jgi:hypothetical protein
LMLENFRQFRFKERQIFKRHSDSS